MAKTKSQDRSMSRSALRRLREKEIRYNTILKAAENLFAKKGYHRTSIEEIADLAEVSTGAVYFYFKNKEDILIKLMHEIGHQLRKLLGEELQKADFSFDSFQNIAFAFLRDFCLSQPEKLAIFFRESAGRSSEVEEQRKQLFIDLTQDIKEAFIRINEEREKNSVSGFAPELIAVCIVGVYERIACHYFLWKESSKEDVEDIAQKSVSFMLGGIESLIKG
ncbi:MAG TPA: TetR/AcrR family transcriptional regulator [Deltaproteobacteria bacterium]|nr:TetR/AcrR family transcriptional regulator [Deltaproteobacteria bacterium]HQI02806.1 TetR/AcrR family transcriptional regulator [Deltaproteobacteria bacterium]HQJ08790.1 TetR/AcrR family transcriptional regulator [Deltaproteobacteria bacterium]